MTGVDVAIVGLFLICCLYLFTPTEADDREVRERIEQQLEDAHYRPYDREEDDGDDD